MSKKPTKLVILAGGLGSRLSEETDVRPKPMVEIGGRPIIWHIMKMYSAHGINDFILCLGYKGYIIKEYFQNYFLHTSDVTVDFKSNKTTVHQQRSEPWRVTLVDTGDSTMTGGRLKRIRDYIGDDTFCMTYGDGVSDIDISAEIGFHMKHGRHATMAVVQPAGRFGSAELQEDQVSGFKEKPQDESGWINGGFFILSPKVFDLIDSDETIWEQKPLERLASSNQLMAFKHNGFWHAMDTLRDKLELQDMWNKNAALWRVWN